MGVLKKVFGRTRSSTSPDPSRDFDGLIRIGTGVYNAQWNFAPVLNKVYANPTGYACVNTIVRDFSRPNLLMNRPPMMSGTQMLHHHAMDLELNGRSVCR